MYVSFLICGGLCLAYGWIILRRWWAWLRVPDVVPTVAVPTTFISVIIPVRNEARHILNLLADLEQQTYAKSGFEVVVVDDHSEDNTVDLVQNFKKSSYLPVRLICLQEYIGLSQKKAAITTAVTQAQGELIVQTDGDCRVNPDWLLTIAQFYEQTQAVCISGPVCLIDNGDLFTRMQVVEFASLIGVGGASMALGKPNMCNGANLAYTRKAFLDVQGYAGTEHVASGDDEFLMHKLAGKFPGQVLFLKSRASMVYTAAQQTIPAFVQQRIRWASKWPNYQAAHIKTLAVLVFAVNLGLFWAIISYFFGGFTGPQTLGLYLFKFGIDGLFLLTVLLFFKRGRYILYQIPLQFVYIPYVLYTALRGLRGAYSWKGRQIEKVPV
ncbi:glycosyltransferase [Adhaeribacter swui]|uniref:Glycosyltransferase n=1 Tax=Adhaeribacter swui TaxID=2086471 RepID=A0A7G7GBW3_9BACT|nr:glycosyltransferase [Adhaeribacter swui]QNF34647.1 glycosyltransferase [Adhaeribacter swui]